MLCSLLLVLLLLLLHGKRDDNTRVMEDEPKYEKLPFLKRAQVTSLSEAEERNEEAANYS